MKNDNRGEPTSQPSTSPEITTEILMTDLADQDGIERLFEELVDRSTGLEKILEKINTAKTYGGDVTGGDLDDDWYQAEVVGEEAIGGQNPTPDQNVTEDILQSTGLSSIDGEPVRTREKLEWRDSQRWELNPESSDDYQDRL